MEQSAKEAGKPELDPLENKVEDLRGRLAWVPQQVDEINALYARFVEVGRQFPADLEEHSLKLILKFIRPFDDRVARQLATVLRRQGKPVPPEVSGLAGRGIAATPEELAANRREFVGKATRGTDTLALHERLIFVMGLPKSASRLMVSAVAAMHPHKPFARGASTPYTTGFVGYDLATDLRYDELVGYAGGGVVHSHAFATNVNRQALARLGLAQVITVRHPADHLAALYCHIRRVAGSGLADPRERRRVEEEARPDPLNWRESYAGDEPSRLSFHGVLFPVDLRFFLPAVDVDDAIAHMIVSGYLYHALSWIVSWQLLRVRNTSIVVRYEDFIERPDETLRAVNATVFGNGSEDAVRRGLGTIARKSYDAKPDPAIYPRGSTGAIGIWRNYLSPANRERYNSVCEKFVAAHPYGSLLGELYDDLIIDVKAPQ